MPYLGNSFCLSTVILYLNGKLRILDWSTDKKNQYMWFSALRTKQYILFAQDLTLHFTTSCLCLFRSLDFMQRKLYKVFKFTAEYSEDSTMVTISLGIMNLRKRLYSNGLKIKKLLLKVIIPSWDKNIKGQLLRWVVNCYI